MDVYKILQFYTYFKDRQEMHFYDTVLFNNAYSSCFKLMPFDVFALEPCSDKINLTPSSLPRLYARLRCPSPSPEFASFLEFALEISFLSTSGTNDFCRTWKLKGRASVSWTQKVRKDF